jgi:hypothetical protein
MHSLPGLRKYNAAWKDWTYIKLRDAQIVLRTCDFLEIISYDALFVPYAPYRAMRLFHYSYVTCGNHVAAGPMSTHTHNSRAVMMLRTHSGLHPVQTGSEGHNAPSPNIRFREHEECVQKGFQTWYEGEISRLNISSESNYFIIMSVIWYSLL